MLATAFHNTPREAGLRRLLRFGIDHPDGLYDPLGYLRRLQGHFIAPQAPEEAVNPRLDAPLVVEKILAAFGVTTPRHWPS